MADAECKCGYGRYYPERCKCLWRRVLAARGERNVSVRRSNSGSQPPRDLVWREQAQGAIRARNVHRPAAFRIVTLLDEKSELGAEVARLRTALEQIAELNRGYGPSRTRIVAREALRPQDRTTR